MSLYMVYACNQKQQARDDMGYCPIMPYFMTITVSGKMKFQSGEER